MHHDAQQPVFRALADPTRRAILTLLTERPCALNEITGHFEMSRPAIAKHLSILEEGGLIHTHSKGRERINTLCPERLKQAHEWLSFFEVFWDDRLAKLKQEVERPK